MTLNEFFRENTSIGAVFQPLFHGMPCQMAFYVFSPYRATRLVLYFCHATFNLVLRQLPVTLLELLA